MRHRDDQLFMVVADYDRRRTEGMSSEDMIAAISETYGQPVEQVPSRPIGTPTVQYGFPDTTLESLARTAAAAAVRLDTAEAPQRELARQKKEAADAAAAQEKAKTENKAQFRP